MKEKLTKILAVITALFIVFSIPTIAVDGILDGQETGENYTQDVETPDTSEQYGED